MAWQPAIASMSLGRAAFHSLEHKLDQAELNGFKGIEMFFDDLDEYAFANPPYPEDITPTESDSEATTQPRGGPAAPREQPSAHASLLHAARSIRRLCSARGLEIIALQPFRHYEGLLDRTAHAHRLDELALWIAVAAALGTDIIGIPSTFLAPSELSSDISVHIADLRAAADLGAAANPPIRFAYEALAWGTLVDTWEASWAVCKAVDRPNFGIVLDTFNMAGRAYADPATDSGTIGSLTPTQARAAMHKSLRRLVRDVRGRMDKVFYIQVADGERLASPVAPGHEFYAADQPPRMSWSRNCRLFYGEEDRGAYLPVDDIIHTLIDKETGLGFEGWISMEVFSRSLADPRPQVPQEHAGRAGRSWTLLKERFPVLSR